MGEAVGRQRLEVLVFEIGGRLYGLPSSEVSELLRAVAVVPMPIASPVIEGIINLRGLIVPVLDLRTRIGLPSKASEPSDHLVVVSFGGRKLALRIDRALELATMGEAQVDLAVGVSPGWQGVSVVVTRPDGLVPVLDLRSLLTTSEAIAISEVSPESPGDGGGMRP